MKSRKGFTLIELLVVIAIIALLLSILMPSLQKVKKQAQAVVCRSNLKQLYLAQTMYTEDNDNKLWRGFYWPSTASTCHSFTVHNWWMPALIKYAGEIPKIRFCPTATKLRYQEDGFSPGPGWRKEPFTAWGYNPGFLALYSPYPNCDTGSYTVNAWIEDNWNDCTAGSELFWRRSNKISQAGTVPFLTAGQWIDVWPQPNYDPPNTENEVYNSSTAASQMTRIVQNRHNKQQNVIFMDGSSRLVGLKELWTLKWHREYNTKGPWTKAGGATPAKWAADDAAPWMKNFKEY